MVRYAFVLAATIATSAFAQDGSWQAVAFRDADARERSVAERVYGEFLRRAPEARIAVARLDVDRDDRAELAVRLEHPSTCTGDRCHTALLMFDQRAGWSVAFERRTQRLELGPPSPGTPRAAQLRVDGREIWVFTPRRHYIATLASFGEPIRLDAAPPEVVAQAARSTLERRERAPYRGALFAARAELGGQPLWLVLASSGHVCGTVGCPLLVFAGERSPRLLGELTATEGEPVAVDRAQRSLSVQTSEGVATWQLRDGRLVLAATTYPSAVTPHP